MKKKVKLAFEELERELDVIKTERGLNIKGGISGDSTGVSWDCVLNVFDYLDSNNFNKDYYINMSTYNLHYNPSGNGGINPSDISAVGGFGYMSVNEVQPDILSGFDNSSGFTNNGNKLAVLIPGALPNTSHMVVVTGVRNQSGYQVIDYYDPTLDHYSSTSVDYIKAGYEIGNVGSNPTPWLGSGY